MTQRKAVPSPLRGLSGHCPVIQDLIDQGLIRPCQSVCNTPILPGKKTQWGIPDGTEL